MAEFASSAFPAKFIRCAKRAKDRRLTVDAAQGLHPYIAARDRQESTGINFAGVRDENEALAVVQSARRPADRIFYLLDRS
jgi:hypothetical protein